MNHCAGPLPLLLEPHENESWSGYLGRVANLYSCPVDQLGAALGLIAGKRWPAFHGITLNPTRRDHAAAMLNLTGQQVARMHAQRWDGIALSIAAITRTGPNPWPNLPIGWTYTCTARTCDTCRQADPSHENLLWHLPWVTHCPSHRSTLTDHSGGLVSSASSAERTQTMIELLNNESTGSFAGLEVPAYMVLRAWLECAALFAAAELHGRPRAPSNLQIADHWLDLAAGVALADHPGDVEHLVRRAIQTATLAESHYAKPQLYSPPLRDLIDSSLASWSR